MGDVITMQTVSYKQRFPFCAPVYHEFDSDCYGTLLSDVCVTGVCPPCEELGVLPKPSCEFEG